MKKVFSIAMIAVMMAGSVAYACDTCGCKQKKAEKKATCCAKEGEAKCAAGEKKCAAGEKKCAEGEKKCAEGEKKCAAGEKKCPAAN